VIKNYNFHLTFYFLIICCLIFIFFSRALPLDYFSHKFLKLPRLATIKKRDNSFADNQNITSLHRRFFLNFKFKSKNDTK
jgi:hypothetical protein